jgi:hypothetical protein
VDVPDLPSTTEPCGSELARESVHSVNAVGDWCTAFASKLAPTFVVRQTLDLDQLLSLRGWVGLTLEQRLDGLNLIFEY